MARGLIVGDRRQRRNETPEAKAARIERLRLNTPKALEASKLSDKRNHLSAADVDALHMDASFTDPEWRLFYKGLRNDLRRRYAPVIGDAPQYVILCDRLAMLTTAAHMHDAAGMPIDARLDLEDRIRSLVAQIQRYTEAEKRVELQINASKIEQFESMLAICDHVITDGLLKRTLFGAFRRLAQGSEASQVLAGLTVPTSAVLEHVAGERRG